MAFGSVGFQLDQPAERLPQLPQHICSAKQTLIGGKGCTEKMRVTLTLSLAAQVPCQTELNSTSKEDLARSVAPSHHLGATRAINTFNSSMGFTEWCQSTGLVGHTFRPALKYIKNYTKPYLLKIFCRHMHNEIYSRARALQQSFTNFIIPTSFLKRCIYTTFKIAPV